MLTFVVRTSERASVHTHTHIHYHTNTHTHTQVLGLTDAGLAVVSKHVAAQTLTAESSRLVTADGVDSTNVFLALVNICQRDIKTDKQREF